MNFLCEDCQTRGRDEFGVRSSERLLERINISVWRLFPVNIPMEGWMNEWIDACTDELVDICVQYYPINL